MSAARVTTIEPSGSSLDFWRLRDHLELLGFFVWRDLKVRYRQTAIGVLWFALQPLLATAIFAVVFGRLARLPSDGAPYVVFAYAGLVPWQFFANTVTRGVASAVSDRHLITKVYFPRILLPLAALLSGSVDVAIGFVVLLVMLAVFGIAPTSAILMTPIFFLMTVATGLAVVCWLAPLNVRYRDVAHTMPFLMQVWMFASPVAYSSSLVPEGWHWLYGLNPMVGIIEGFRWAWVGTAPPEWPVLVASAVTVVVLLGGGILNFHRMERTFADVI